MTRSRRHSPARAAPRPGQAPAAGRGRERGLVVIVGRAGRSSATLRRPRAYVEAFISAGGEARDQVEGAGCMWSMSRPDPRRAGGARRRARCSRRAPVRPAARPAAGQERQHAEDAQLSVQRRARPRRSARFQKTPSVRRRARDRPAAGEARAVLVRAGLSSGADTNLRARRSGPAANWPSHCEPARNWPSSRCVGSAVAARGGASSTSEGSGGSRRSGRRGRELVMRQGRPSGSCSVVTKVEIECTPPPSIGIWASGGTPCPPWRRCVRGWRCSVTRDLRR